LEHAASVAKTFLTSDAVAVDIDEKPPLPRRPMSMPMPMSGNFICNAQVKGLAKLAMPNYPVQTTLGPNLDLVKATPF